MPNSAFDPVPAEQTHSCVLSRHAVCEIEILILTIYNLALSLSMHIKIDDIEIVLSSNLVFPVYRVAHELSLLLEGTGSVTYAQRIEGKCGQEFDVFEHLRLSYGLTVYGSRFNSQVV